ncbi:homoserine kinase [Labilibaculum manganireducens]|uniref:Homoserine kinase n=1 Tax=Labilibaculum manganireducens TaxID=1940525 RepID=A0A2N3HVX5_9BACT|nr:homoserine kinase [Labilibaculum manganireducens]PKQ62191.1 homoserine kinase [Labilibaculum manganireducens]
MSDSVKVFAPGSVSNVGCGFDILGFAIDGVGDEMILTKNDQNKIIIQTVKDYEDLPTDPKKNVAGVAIQALLDDLESNQGFDVEMIKNIKPGSGIGSSAASAAGAVVAVNELLGKPYTRMQLVDFAMKGEEVASGDVHADNVAPATLGGFCLIRGYNPLDVIHIQPPADLWCAVIHPQIEIKTKEAREILSPQIPLKKAIRQWGNVAGLMAGLYTADYDLIGRSLEDHIVEPQRKVLIPEFDELKLSVMEAGALGCSISGSGPSVFALANGKESADVIAAAMDTVYKRTGLDYKIYVSKVSEGGVKIL